MRSPLIFLCADSRFGAFLRGLLLELFTGRRAAPGRNLDKAKLQKFLAHSSLFARTFFVRSLHAAPFYPGPVARVTSYRPGSTSAQVTSYPTNGTCYGH